MMLQLLLCPPEGGRGSIWARLFAAVGRFFSGEGTEPSAEERNRQAEQLLDRYGQSVLRLSYAYLHNMSDAEEILQDTLVQFLKTSPVFDSPDHEKAWLRVASNLCKNRLIYDRRRRADPLSETLAQEDRPDLSFVWEAVKALPVHQREVVHLFYHEGFATAEIARIVGRKESTVRSDLRRARLRLKEILKEGYDL